MMNLSAIKDLSSYLNFKFCINMCLNSLAIFITHFIFYNSQVFKKQICRCLLLYPFAVYHVWGMPSLEKSIKANIFVYRFHYKFPIKLGGIVPYLRGEVFLHSSPFLPSLPWLLHSPLLSCFLSSLLPFFLFLLIKNNSIVFGK